MNAKTVLVVDDEKDIRKIVSRILEKSGYKAITAGDAMEGLMQLHENSVDLVITDIRMPGMNGLDLIKQVHEIQPGIPVIIITGYGTFDLAVEALARGAFFFVTKPFETSTLVNVVKKGLRLNFLLRKSDAEDVDSVQYDLSTSIAPSEEKAEAVVRHIFSTAQSLGYDSHTCLARIPFILDELLMKAVNCSKEANVEDMIVVEAGMTREEINISIKSPVRSFHKSEIPGSFSDSDINSPKGVSLMVAMYYADSFEYSEDEKVASFGLVKSKITATEN